MGNAIPYQIPYQIPLLRAQGLTETETVKEIEYGYQKKIGPKERHDQ
jgi:hypothetical protein